MTVPTSSKKIMRRIVNHYERIYSAFPTLQALQDIFPKLYLEPSETCRCVLVSSGHTPEGYTYIDVDPNCVVLLPLDTEVLPAASRKRVLDVAITLMSHLQHTAEQPMPDKEVQEWAESLRQELIGLRVGQWVTVDLTAEEFRATIETHPMSDNSLQVVVPRRRITPAVAAMISILTTCPA